MPFRLNLNASRRPKQTSAELQVRLHDCLLFRAVRLCAVLASAFRASIFLTFDIRVYKRETESVAKSQRSLSGVSHACVIGTERHVCRTDVQPQKLMPASAAVYIDSQRGRGYCSIDLVMFARTLHRYVISIGCITRRSVFPASSARSRCLGRPACCR
jgi:hypothetical protein